HEADQGQGRRGGRLRARDGAGRVLRLPRAARPRGVQGRGRRHHRQPPHPGPGRRRREGLHPGPLRHRLLTHGGRDARAPWGPSLETTGSIAPVSANPDFDLFRTSEDHETLREAVRAVAEGRIAPFAAAVDEESRFPTEANEALIAADFHAAHVAEEHGGVGADALAVCIIIEEVARVCASSSLIPAVNKLGSMPVILGGSEEINAKYMPRLAKGEGFSYGLSEREAGSDTAAMRCRATKDGEDWVLGGQKAWITNAGESEFYTVMAVTDPDGPRG